MNTIQSFPQLLMQQGKAWNPAAFFDVNVERWQPLWEQASEESKQTLAHAYLWAYSNFQDSNCPSTPEGYWNENIWTTHHSWFRQIEPYVDRSYVTKENLGHGHDYLSTIFGIARDSDKIENKTLTKLWFGSLEDRTTALHAFANVIKDPPFFVTGNLIPTIAWAHLDESYDQQTHINALLLSYAAGRSCRRPPKECNSQQKAWTTLGFLDYAGEKTSFSGKKGSDNKPLSVDDCWKDEFTKNNLMAPEQLLLELQNTPAPIAAAAIKSIIPKIGIKYEENAWAIYDHAYLGYLINNENGATDLELARLVMPSQENVWNIAELTDMPVFDALNMIVSGKRQELHEKQLPPDLMLFGG